MDTNTAGVVGAALVGALIAALAWGAHHKQDAHAAQMQLDAARGREAQCWRQLADIEHKER